MHLLPSYAAALSVLGMLGLFSPAVQPAPVAAVTSSTAATAADPAISRLSYCPGLVAGGLSTTKPPLLIVLGASFTAGVGAGEADDAWPYDLAHLLGWRVLADGVSGAGYVNPGHLHLGPLAHLVANLRLSRLDPSMIIIQAGHNDMGAPAALLSERVASLLDTVRHQAPEARIVLLTVFSRRQDGLPAPVSEAARLTDSTIVTAARRADPGATILDPLARRWRFPTRRDHLHPTPAGHLRIARYVAHHLCGASRRVPRPSPVSHLPHRTRTPAGPDQS